MKILHISNSDIIGGAARAAYRIHRSFEDNYENKDILSRMLVINKKADDPTTESYLNSNRRKIRVKAARYMNKLSRKWFQTNNPIIHSIAKYKNGFGEYINSLLIRENYDIVHLHWLGDSTLSIEEIGKFNLPIVWTLHDEWAYCGAEHYRSLPKLNEKENNDYRYAEGYLSSNRPNSESGFDINKQTWERKYRSWKKPFHIVAISKYFGVNARKSLIMREWPVNVIPNPIDNSIWSPINKSFSKELFNLPKDKTLILFGAIGGTKDPRKGADLLVEALSILSQSENQTSLNEIELVIFGQNKPLNHPNLSFPVHYVGHLNDDESLRALYSAADIVIVPSRLEGLGQVACEAHSCGTPVVAFNTGGLPDVVDHMKTGFLADPFEASSLAKGISWVLENDLRYKKLCKASRERAINLWSPCAISKQYLKVYEDAIFSYKK